MKRQLLIILAICAATTLSAQVGKYRNDLAVGFNAGMVMNRVNFKPSVPQGMHMGMEMGISLRYTCEKFFSAVCALQTEINFQQLGWKEDIITSNDTYSRTMNYISIPLLARLGWGRERKGFMGYVMTDQNRWEYRKVAERLSDKEELEITLRKEEKRSPGLRL